MGTLPLLLTTHLSGAELHSSLTGAVGEAREHLDGSVSGPENVEWGLGADKGPEAGRKRRLAPDGKPAG